MTTTYPHRPAAFINTIAESGTKQEAIEHLQALWNEVVVLRAAVDAAINWYTPPNDSGPFPIKQLADARASLSGGQGSTAV